MSAGRAPPGGWLDNDKVSSGILRRELRRIDYRGPHRRSGRVTGGVLAALTERELQVARLVVDRKTNAEIAATLFLSRKTVEPICATCSTS